MEKNPRKIALDVLAKVENGQYANLALDAILERSELSNVNKNLATALVYGVLEKKLRLDYAIAFYAGRPPEKISPDAKGLLRLGFYQLCFMERIPDYAVVNETVALASPKIRGFVNAILRTLIRHNKELPLPPAEPKETYLSVRYSVCPELAKKLLDTLGEEKTVSFSEALETHPALTVRTNTLRISRDDLLAKFRADGFSAEKTEQSGSGIKLFGNAPVTELYGFRDGLFFVQDEASQLAVESLDAKPNMQVLDVCACPGSKSFGIAIEMQNKGKILSCDLHKSKLSLVVKSAKRLGIEIVETRERDAREPLPEYVGNADRVLCDVPCSGFGVIGKKPELRYKNPAESEKLPQIQSEILMQSANLLKIGGRLVYSTCTVLPDENENNIARFLSERKDYRLLSEKTFYPDTDGTDGFFIAVLERI